MGIPGMDEAAAEHGLQRLFFALWPDAATRARIAQAVEALRAQHAHAGRWIRPERYHLTLQFLGDFSPLPPRLADEAGAAAQCVRAAPFTLALDHAGSFRNRSIPWWLGCSDPPHALRALWEELGAALRAAHVRYDTRLGFAPHLTVLRDARSPLDETPIAPLAWPVREFVLIESRLGGTNPGYSVLRRFPLRVAG